MTWWSQLACPRCRKKLASAGKTLTVVSIGLERAVGRWDA